MPKSRLGVYLVVIYLSLAIILNIDIFLNGISLGAGKGIVSFSRILSSVSFFTIAFSPFFFVNYLTYFVPDALSDYVIIFLHIFLLYFIGAGIQKLLGKIKNKFSNRTGSVSS